MGYLIWDFDGTLATRHGGWAATLCEVLAEERPGLAVAPEALGPHLRTGFPWHAHEVIRTPRGADEWWEGLTPLFARALGAITDLSERDSLRLARRVREVYLREERWALYDDVLPVLTALSGSGWRHLVLSNHAPELEAIIGRLGLAPLIDAVYNSAVTGKEKPNPAAYECVFADFQEARDGWMIGDNWTADVQGAEAVGLRSILVRRDHPEASVRCETLHEVVGVIDGQRGPPVQDRFLLP